MCGVQLEDRKRAMDLMLILNETVFVGMVMCCHMSCVEEGG